MCPTLCNPIDAGGFGSLHTPRPLSLLQRGLAPTVGEGEGGMIWENGIEICIISYMKLVASPGSMHDTGCLGLVHWDCLILPSGGNHVVFLELLRGSQAPRRAVCVSMDSPGQNN